MAAAVAATGFWNHRERLNTWPEYTQANVCRVTVDTDVLKDTLESLVIVHPKLRQTELWSELAIMETIINKHGNKHRKQFYFQGLRRVAKNLNRLQEIGICYKLVDVRNSFISLQNNRLVSDMLPSYPSIGLIVNMLGCLTGAAQIILQVISFCQETVKLSCSELFYGHYVTFHLTLISSLSRVWVFLKSYMLAVAECYDIIFPWLNLLQDTHKTKNSEAKDLPKSLKMWVGPLKTRGSDKTPNSTSVTPSAKTSVTPGALDKLFASTPRQSPKDALPSLLPEFNARSLTGPSPGALDNLFASTPRQKPQDTLPSLLNLTFTEPPYDFGKSFVSDDFKRPLECSDAMVAEESTNLKTRLFPESPENEDHVPINSTCARKRKAAEFIDSEVSGPPSNKLATELKRFLNKESLCRRLCSTIRIFGNKTWKNSVEKKLRKKLAQQQLKKKQRRRQANTDAALTKKRKKKLSSKDEVGTRKKRKGNQSKGKTQAEKKRKADTRRVKATIKVKRKLKSDQGEKVAKKKKKNETSGDLTCTEKKRKADTRQVKAPIKVKRKLKSDRGEKVAKKKRKDETSGDLTRTKKKRKVTACKNETRTLKKRKVKPGADETQAKKKRKVTTCEDETHTLKKRKEKPGKDERNTKKNKKLKTLENKTKPKKKSKGANGDVTGTKKKRAEKSGKSELQPKKKIKIESSQDGTDTRKKPKLKTGQDKTSYKKTRKTTGNKVKTVKKKKGKGKTGKDGTPNEKKKKRKLGRRNSQKTLKLVKKVVGVTTAATKTKKRRQ
ncbi:hypothetical protein ACROYT_G042269 [Oculina patagonica]